MTHRIHAFWDWFVRNARRVERITNGEDAAGQDLLRQLQRVHRGVTFELGFAPDLGFHLIISADGKRDLFTTVHRIVDAAPNVEGWTFTALRPRRELPIKAALGLIEVDSEKIWFSAVRRDGLVDLSLYFEQFVDDRMIEAVGFLLLDVALGEFDTETKVGRIECLPLQSDAAKSAFIPFKELPGYVDALGVGVM
jgi:hypothetical protein